MYYKMKGEVKDKFIHGNGFSVIPKEADIKFHTGSPVTKNQLGGRGRPLSYQGLKDSRKVRRHSMKNPSL